MRKRFNENVDQMTASDVSEKLGKSVQWVYNQVKNGKLEAINISFGDQRPRYVFNKSEVERFARSQQTLFVHAACKDMKTYDYEELLEDYKELKANLKDMADILKKLKKRNKKLKKRNIKMDLMATEQKARKLV